MIALEGIRVIDLTQWLMGPFTCTTLASWGAEVIKIEDLSGGDPSRGLLSIGALPMARINYIFELANHSKKSICVDLRKEEGKKIVYSLVEGADVFVSNLRLAALKRLGMDYDTLTQFNPRLIYAHGNGYGQKGPERDKAGFDETAFWARAGFMDIVGEPGTPVVPLRGAIGDLCASQFLAGGIMLALFARERTGLGQEVDVSLLGSGVWTNALDIQVALGSGLKPIRESRKTKGTAFVNTYQTKDGRWLMLAMHQSDPYWNGLCKAIGREDLEHDPRFDSHKNRGDNSVALIAILDEILATKTIAEWAKIFDEHGIVWALGQTVAEVIADPQVSANEYIVDFEHPVGGAMKLVACPIQLSKTPGKVRSAAPELGQHTEEILLEMGYSWHDIAELKDRKVII